LSGSSSSSGRWRGSVSTQRGLTGSSHSKTGTIHLEKEAWRFRSFCGLGWGFRRQPGRVPGAGRAGKPQSPGAADRGVAGIGGVEFRVDRLRGLRDRTCPWQGAPATRLNAPVSSSSIAFGASLIPVWSDACNCVIPGRVEDAHLESPLRMIISGFRDWRWRILERLVQFLIFRNQSQSLISDNRNCYHF